MLPHIPGKIIPTRRIEHTFPKNAKVEMSLDFRS